MRGRLTATIIAACALALGGGGCEVDRAPAPNGRLKIAASIFPLADAARQIGGDDIDVLLLLPPGTSPHNFQPHPRQAEELAGFRLLLDVGLGLDPWAEQGVAVGTKVVRFADVVEHAHEHDPHLWLDPVLMKAYVLAAADAMAALDPAHAEAYARRARAYVAELDRLDADYRTMAANAETKTFVTFHPAFSHLARRYGLTQSTVAHSHAEAGGARELEAVVDFVRRNKLKVIFAEPQFPADRLTWLRQQTGAAVETLDPIGNPALPGRDSYLAMMRSNLRTLAAALSE